MGRIRVLLVDDDERYARTLAAFLRTHEDLDVVGTSMSGKDAIEDFERLQPDVVVMDAYMPEMDGIEATRALTAARPGVRVIMLTAHDTADLKDRALKAGAVGFLSKQNAARDLPAEIRLYAGDATASQEFSRGGLGRGLSALIPNTARESQTAEPQSPESVGTSKGDAEGAPGAPAARYPEIVVTVSVSVHGGGWWMRDSLGEWRTEFHPYDQATSNS